MHDHIKRREPSQTRVPVHVRLHLVRQDETTLLVGLAIRRLLSAWNVTEQAIRIDVVAIPVATIATVRYY